MYTGVNRVLGPKAEAWKLENDVVRPAVHTPKSDRRNLQIAGRWTGVALDASICA